MDQNACQRRHIAANLEHGADGSTTLRTTVQHEPLRHGADEELQEDVTSSPAEVQDVGWNDDQIRPEDYAIDGIKNEDVWLLVRRFNKRVFQLNHAPNHPEDEMDFDVAEEEQFSANKLRAQIERLYMGAATLLKTPILEGTKANIMFLSIHYPGGHLIKPAAGILGTVDTARGAPESLKGETLEREASNFATGLVALSINIFVDKDPQHDESQRGGGNTVNLPDPRSLATGIATAKDKAAGIEKRLGTRENRLCRSLCIGVEFFSNIFLRNSYDWLKHNMERIVFRGIPTDSQLKIALLRQGERNKAPLPPSPEPKGPPLDEPLVLEGDALSASAGDRPVGASPEEIRRAAQEEPGVVQDTGGDDHEYPLTMRAAEKDAAKSWGLSNLLFRQRQRQ
ncbi:hypothetical protein FCOIX_12555 [Fusarium coicis]|nr:hypothetical protein FCOIX_12555 [Fusarium coicis]